MTELGMEIAGIFLAKKPKEGLCWALTLYLRAIMMLTIKKAQKSKNCNFKRF